MNVELSIKIIYNLIKSYELFYYDINLDKKIKYDKLILSDLTLYKSNKWKTDLYEFIKLYIDFSNFINYINNFSKKLLKDLSLSEDDLYVLINRSHSYIFDQFSEIQKLKNETINVKNLLKIEYKKINNYLHQFINLYLKSQTYSKDYVDNILSLLLETNNLPIIYNILSIFINLKLDIDKTKLNDFLDLYMSKLFNLSPNKIIYGNKEINNELQKFNIVPDDMPISNISSIIKLLFNVNLNSNDNIFKSLDKLLKSLSIDGNHKCIIIKYNSGDENYFDISNLIHPSENSDLKKIKKETGINTFYINMFNNLHFHKGDKSSTNKFICINTENIHSNSEIYILFTNNLNSFRCKIEPINKFFLDKLMRNNPSDIIKKYNLSMENSIINKRIDAIDFEFKKINYYNFTDISSEEDTLKNIELDLIKYLNREIDISYSNNKNIYGLAEIINSISFSDNVSNIIYKYKPIESKNSILDVIFMNDTISIVKKLKKEIIDISNKYTNKTNEEIKKEIPEIINYVLKPNSNIYNKYINAYYLSILNL